MHCHVATDVAFLSCYQNIVLPTLGIQDVGYFYIKGDLIGRG